MLHLLKKEPNYKNTTKINSWFSIISFPVNAIPRLIPITLIRTTTFRVCIHTSYLNGRNPGCFALRVAAEEGYIIFFTSSIESPRN